MKRHPFIARLVQYPWAIVESYVPLVAGVLTRIACGEEMSELDRAHIEARRAAYRAGHPVLAMDDTDIEDYPDRPPPEPYARVSTAASGGSVVAVIPVYGVLTQRGGFDADTSEPLTSMIQVTRAVQLAAADPVIGGIVLDVDSPGGSVYGVAELGDAIHAARDAKPIAAVANSLMASAAYWMGSQASELYAAPGAEVGSIGVYTVHTNVAEFLKQKGVSVEMISAGKFKTEGNPYGALSDEARANIQASVDQYYDAFIRAVARGRNASLKSVREDMGQGRVMQGDAAKTAGMIDGVATLDQVIAKIGARAKRASARADMERRTKILKLG